MNAWASPRPRSVIDETIAYIYARFFFANGENPT